MIIKSIEILFNLYHNLNIEKLKMLPGNQGLEKLNILILPKLFAQQHKTKSS